MLSLGSFRITTKILSVVVLLNIAMIAVGLVGILALRVVASDADLATQAANRAVASARLNQLVIGINRFELLVAASPKADLIEEISQDYRTDVARIDGYLDTIRASSAPEVQAILAKVEPAVSQLIASSEKTIAVAQQVRGTATPEQAQQLSDLALVSREKTVSARELIAEQSSLLINRANSRRDHIAEIAQSKEILLYIVMASTTIAGLGLGLLIGQSGIASPIRTIEDMSNISAAIFAAVGEQGNTTTEVARNVQQASQGAGEVTSNIVGVTQAAQEASSASAQVLSSASELAQQSEVLRGRVADFLRTVRAA